VLVAVAVCAVPGWLVKYFQDDQHHCVVMFALKAVHVTLQTLHVGLHFSPSSTSNVQALMPGPKL
jgi:hypothetical protein